MTFHKELKLYQRCRSAHEYHALLLWFFVSVLVQETYLSVSLSLKIIQDVKNYAVRKSFPNKTRVTFDSFFLYVWSRECFLKRRQARVVNNSSFSGGGHLYKGIFSEFAHLEFTDIHWSIKISQLFFILSPPFRCWNFFFRPMYCTFDW